MTEIGTKTTLGELGTRHVWFTSVGQPAGCDLIEEEGDDFLALPGDSDRGDGPWWDLEGQLVGCRWEWNGAGAPRDFNGNTVTRLVAFVAP